MRPPAESTWTNWMNCSLSVHAVLPISDKICWVGELTTNSDEEKINARLYQLNGGEWM